MKDSFIRFVFFQPSGFSFQVISPFFCWHGTKNVNSDKNRRENISSCRTSSSASLCSTISSFKADSKFVQNFFFFSCFIDFLVHAFSWGCFESQILVCFINFLSAFIPRCFFKLSVFVIEMAKWERKSWNVHSNISWKFQTWK